MVLYLGGKELYAFIAQTGAVLSCDVGEENIEKIIIAEASENAISAVKFAMDNQIPLLGVLDGYQGVICAFGGECAPVECAEGKQEWAVIDADMPVFKGLESVVKVCRGSPVALVEETKPQELDCIARAETGEVLAVRNVLSSGGYGDIYAVNFYIHSSLTPNGIDIINNFLKIRVEGSK